MSVSQMLTISEDQDCFTLLIFFKAPPDLQRRVLDINIDVTRGNIAHMPGFVGAAFLKSLDGGRVTEYLQWESEGHLQEAMKDPDFFEHMAEVREIATDDTSPYEVHRVAGPDTVEISVEAGLLTAVTKFVVDPEEQQELLRLLVAAREPLLGELPGFLSAAILGSPDGGSAVEYLQFEDRGAFDAFVERSGRGGGYREKIDQLARSETSLYEVDSTARATR